MPKYILRKPMFFYSCDTYSTQPCIFPILEVSPIEDESALEYIQLGKNPNELINVRCSLAEYFIEATERLGKVPHVNLYNPDWYIENLVDESGTPFNEKSLFRVFKEGVYKALLLREYHAIGYSAWLHYENEGVRTCKILDWDHPVSLFTNQYLISSKNLKGLSFSKHEKGARPPYLFSFHHYIIQLIDIAAYSEPTYVGRNFPEKPKSYLCTDICMAKRFSNEEDAVAFAIENEAIANMGFDIKRIDREIYKTF